MDLTLDSQMMIVVDCITKFGLRVSWRVSGSGNNTFPHGVVCEWGWLLVVNNSSKGVLQLCQSASCKTRVAQQIMDGVHNSCILANCFAPKIHAPAVIDLSVKIFRHFT